MEGRDGGNEAGKRTGVGMEEGQRVGEGGDEEDSRSEAEWEREPERIFYEWHSAAVVRHFLFSFDSRSSATTNLQHTHIHTLPTPPPPTQTPPNSTYYPPCSVLRPRGTIGPLLKLGRR